MQLWLVLEKMKVDVDDQYLLPRVHIDARFELNIRQDPIESQTRICPEVRRCSSVLQRKLRDSCLNSSWIMIAHNVHEITCVSKRVFAQSVQESFGRIGIVVLFSGFLIAALSKLNSILNCSLRLIREKRAQHCRSAEDDAKEEGRKSKKVE